MGRIETRLKKVEEQLGAGACICIPRRGGIWHTNCWRGDDCDTQHEPPPDVCEVCGGTITSFQIIYVDDWRAQK